VVVSTSPLELLCIFLHETLFLLYFPVRIRRLFASFHIHQPILQSHSLSALSGLLSLLGSILSRTNGLVRRELVAIEIDTYSYSPSPSLLGDRITALSARSATGPGIMSRHSGLPA
jgi:hypothetical protein